MDIQTLTVELLRAGPRHNQLISPTTQYLGLCGSAPASRVVLPYEHGELERKLRDLRYEVSDSVDQRRCVQVLDQTGREMARLLASIEGVTGALEPKGESADVLTHLRIVLSASELSMLPFEATKVPAAENPGSAWLALQSRAPVCITRHIRSALTQSVLWPSELRILFVVGPDTHVQEQHEAALTEVLQPWRNSADKVDHLLTVLEHPSKGQIRQAIGDAWDQGKPFTHVHVLAHGAHTDGADRYSPIGLQLHDGEEPFTGDRLASALTAVSARGIFRPTVVTLASCDSGRQVDTRTTEAAMAHALHDAGIPLVVASQFPLTVDGSIPFVHRFYTGQLRGDHPLLTICELRSELHSRMPADTHDWASLVVYEALPADLFVQLQNVRYWQSRRALELALQRLEKLPVLASAAETLARWNRAKADVEARSADLPRTGGYALECSGLRAAALKRVALAALEQVSSAGSGGAHSPLLDDWYGLMTQSRHAYWQAAKSFLLPSGEALRRKSNLHWLIGQVLSLDVMLDMPIDSALWSVAHLAARVDLDSANESERAWAHVSLAELALLRLAEPSLTVAERDRQVADSLAHVRSMLELVGIHSEQAKTTARQFERYAKICGDTAYLPLLGQLGLQPRPAWLEPGGLAKEALALAAGLTQKVTARHGPGTAASASSVQPATPAQVRRASSARMPKA